MAELAAAFKAHLARDDVFQEDIREELIKAGRIRDRMDANVEELLRVLHMGTGAARTLKILGAVLLALGGLVGFLWDHLPFIHR